MAAPAAVAFEGIVKRYGKFTALDGLTLQVRRGEVYGLLGPNGSGKTTAIKVLVGLERRTAGDVRALGQAAPSRELLARIGYMPQETALYQDLTVAENLDLFGALYGLSRARTRERAAEMLALVGLSDWAAAPVSTLSGGMKHRASLVVALLHDPELLVLDEPTVGVDPELRVGFWSHFRGLKSRDRTVLITTHYMDEARNCDRIGLLRAGKLIAEGTVEEVLRLAQAKDLEEAFVRLAGRASKGATA